MLTNVLAGRTTGVKFSYLSGGLSQGKGLGEIQQAAVKGVRGGESWEIISGQESKTSQSLNLQVLYTYTSDETERIR